MPAILILLSIFLLAPPSFGSDIQDAWGVPRLEAEKVLVITHPSVEYDTQYVAKQPMERELLQAKALNIPAVILIDTLLPQSNYLDLNTFDFAKVFLAGTGGHNLSFKTAPIYRLAGGHFNYCACRTLRDIILRESHREKKQPILIELVRDALYFFPENTDTLDWPERYSLDGNSDGISETLVNKELFPRLITTARALEDEYFPVVRGKRIPDAQKTMCKEYRDRFTFVHKGDFEFNILDTSGKVVRTFGTLGAQKVQITLD